MAGQANLKPSGFVECTRGLKRSMKNGRECATHLFGRDVFRKRMAKRNIGEKLECAAAVWDGSANHRIRAVGGDQALEYVCIAAGACVDRGDHCLPGFFLIAY